MVHYEPIISKFIAVSDQIRSRLIELMPNRQQDIVRLSYPSTRKAVRVRPETHRTILRIGYAGRIQHYQKRILDLQDLAVDLSRRRGFYSFEIAGDGTHLKQLKHFFEQHQFDNVSVKFYGLLEPESVEAFWSSVDVGILFSSHEGLSISMIESMAAGCVQVLTNVSGVGETVKSDIHGYVHEVGNTEAMADSLQMLFEHPELLSAMSAACIDHVERNHDADHYDSQILHLAQEAWEEDQRHWPRFRRLIPASVLARERSRLRPKQPISLRGRVKLKCIDIIKSLGKS
jgi:glycosyltransferase involved in cell wall biosynthesis